MHCATAVVASKHAGSCERLLLNHTDGTIGFRFRLSNDLGGGFQSANFRCQSYGTAAFCRCLSGLLACCCIQRFSSVRVRGVVISGIAVQLHNMMQPQVQFGR